MAATRPRYCGVLLVAALWLTVGLVCPGHLAAQKKKRTPPPPPFAALFPLEEAWTITLPAAPVRTAARDGSRVVVPLVTGDVVALGWHDGETLWSAALNATTAPLSAAGVFFIGAGDTLHALDPASGMPRWSAQARGRIQELAFANGRVFAVGAGLAQAFDATGGASVWTQTPSAAGDVTGLGVSNDALVASFANGAIVALALGDGHTLWTHTIDSRPSAPIALKDTVYVGATDNRLYALAAKSGKERWSWRTGGDVVGAAADAKAVYYTSLDAVVRAVNPGNGHQRWKRDGGTRSVAPPLALDGAIVVAGLTPALSSFAPLTGVPQGTFELPGELQGVPLVSAQLMPRSVAMVVALKDGRTSGLRSLSLMFNESAPPATFELPGKTLTRERLP